MGKDFCISVGTVGSGIWRSLDGGDAWSRVRPTRVTECDIRSLAVHPRYHNILYAGTDSGLYRSENRGSRWERLDSPMNSMHTWAIGIDPDQPDTIFAGTKPSALFRSKDGGQRWERLPVDLAEECPSTIVPRVTVLVFDPEDHRVPSGRASKWMVCGVARMEGTPGLPSLVEWRTQTSTA